jgi:thioredoxin-related protein
MLSCHRFATSACLLAVFLLTATGCGDSTDSSTSADNSGVTDPAPVAPEVPQAGDAADEPTAVADNSAEKKSDEPSKDAFLAAAQKGVNVDSEKPEETPPFVSTPENPGPTEPLFSDPAEPVAGVDPEWRDKWETSFEKAKATALAENKDILMNFTGSDWCGWCIRLGNEVFQHEKFAEYAKKNLVLLELDFPRGFELEKSLQEQNNALQAQYGIEGFPSLLLLDGQGRAYAQTGYQPGGPLAYAEHLETLRDFRKTRDEAFAAAEGLAGAEKAKKLNDGLEAIQPSLRFASYAEVIDQIIELDADDAAGLKTKFESARAEHRFSQRMQEIVTNVNETRDWDTAVADLDKVITEYAAFDGLAIQAQMLQLQVLQAANRKDDLLKLTDQLLSDESLEGQSRLRVYITKLTVLDQSDRLEEALPVVDAILTDFADQKELRINLLMTKASFLGRLGQKDAAKAVIQSVRESAEPSLLPQIDDFEKQILAEPEPEKPEADAAEKPAADATK